MVEVDIEGCPDRGYTLCPIGADWNNVSPGVKKQKIKKKASSYFVTAL